MHHGSERLPLFSVSIEDASLSTVMKILHDCMFDRVGVVATTSNVFSSDIRRCLVLSSSR